MLSILDVTSSNAVRAVLGVAEESGELPDQYFTDRGLASALNLELLEWLPSTLSTLRTAALAAEKDSDEALLWNAVELAATYWCAREIALTGGVALFLRNEDGDNKVARNPLNVKELVEMLGGRYAHYQSLALRLADPDLVAVSTSSGLFGAVKPAYDPVANI